MQRLSLVSKIIIVTYLLINVFVIAAFKIDHEFGMKLLKEDSSVENISVMALFIAAIYILYRSLQNLKRKNYLQGIVQLCIAVFFVFMGGEEISWGQRIFNWQTTGIFKENNLQGETNFHNLKIGGVKLNKLIFTFFLMSLGGFIFLISPWLYKKSERFANFFDRLGVILPSYKHTILLIIGLLLVLIIGDSKEWELWECNATLIILWTVLEPLNKDNVYSTGLSPKHNKISKPDHLQV